MEHVECGYRGVGLEKAQAMGAAGCWKFGGGSCTDPLGESPGICGHVWGFWDLGCVSHSRFPSVWSCLCSIVSCTFPFYNKRLRRCEPGADLSCCHSSLALAFLINDGGVHSPVRFAPFFLPVCCWLHEDDSVLQSSCLGVIDLSKYSLGYARHRVSPKLSHHYIVPLSLILSVRVPCSCLNIILEYRKCWAKTWRSFRTLNLVYEIFANIEVWVTGRKDGPEIMIYSCRGFKFKYQYPCECSQLSVTPALRIWRSLPASASTARICVYTHIQSERHSIVNNKTNPLHSGRDNKVLLFEMIT